MIKLEKLKNPIIRGDTIMLDGTEILIDNNLNCKEIAYNYISGQKLFGYNYNYKIKIDGQDVYFNIQKTKEGYTTNGFYYDKNYSDEPAGYDDDEPYYNSIGCKAFEMRPLLFSDINGNECEAFSVDETKKDIGGNGYFAGFNSTKLTCIKEKVKEKEEEKTEIKKDEGENQTENQNQTFKDIESKNFEFKIKEVQKGENTYILVDNTEFNNFLATKINEFTHFTYIGTFFIFTFLMFYFIKSLIGK